MGRRVTHAHFFFDGDRGYVLYVYDDVYPEGEKKAFFVIRELYPESWDVGRLVYEGKCARPEERTEAIFIDKGVFVTNAGIGRIEVVDAERGRAVASFEKDWLYRGMVKKGNLIIAGAESKYREKHHIVEIEVKKEEGFRLEERRRLKVDGPIKPLLLLKEEEYEAIKELL